MRGSVGPFLHSLIVAGDESISAQQWLWHTLITSSGAWPSPMAAIGSAWPQSSLPLVFSPAVQAHNISLRTSPAHISVSSHGPGPGPITSIYA